MAAIKISQHCRVEHCVPALQGTDKDEIVRELVQTFVGSGALEDRSAGDLITRILQREEEGTTGIGKGVAMPHARDFARLDETLIAVGLHGGGVDWDATDGAPIHVVFLIASTNPQEYLSVAGRIARVARDDVEMRALRRQKTAEAIRAFLEESWD